MREHVAEVLRGHRRDASLIRRRHLRRWPHPPLPPVWLRRREESKQCGSYPLSTAGRPYTMYSTGRTTYARWRLACFPSRRLLPLSYVPPSSGCYLLSLSVPAISSASLPTTAMWHGACCQCKATNSRGIPTGRLVCWWRQQRTMICSWPELGRVGRSSH